MEESESRERKLDRTGGAAELRPRPEGDGVEETETAEASRGIWEEDASGDSSRARLAARKATARSRSDIIAGRNKTLDVGRRVGANACVKCE